MANKTRLISLILGLTMCISLMLGMVFANPANTAHAEGTDTRIPVSTITATSNIDDIVGFGKNVVRPTFTIAEDVPAQFDISGDWQRKTATGWDDYSGTAFIEGTYRYQTQIRIDRDSGGGTTHVLDKNGITVTVNGVKWADNSKPGIADTYSYDWVFSKEYPVVAPAGTPLDFIKDNKWDIDSTYKNQAITAFSVADGAVGGTKPYTFSKVSGPDWLAVAADGTVSGTPTALGANAVLVIKVTDSADPSASKEITLKVGNTYVLPADREVISVIRVTSNIGEILGYGKRVVKPSFTFTEGTQANFSRSMGHWYKKEGTAWKRYEDATFTEGTYMYNNQIRVDDEYGMSHVLNKDGVSVYIDGELCADNQKPDWIYDTYSLIYVDTVDYEVVKPTTVAITDELVPVTDLEKVYNETAQEPTFGGTLVRDTDYEVSYAVKAGAGGALDFGGKPVDAGTYMVTVTGKGAYEGSFTKEFVMNKAEQSAPVGLLANPISCRDSFGKIDGVTAAMEYRKVGDTVFTACTASTITGLEAGEYEVRYAENENCLAGEVAKVTVAVSHNLGVLVEETPATCSAAGMKAHYYCSDCGTFFDESKKETTEEALTVPATGVHSLGNLVAEEPATCSAAGMKAHYKCSVCNKYFDESKTEKTVAELTIAVNPNAHDLGAWIEEVPATCAAKGTKGHQDCNRCNRHYDGSGNEITDLTIPTNDNHDWNAWVSNGDGTHTRTCKRDSGHKENGTCSGGTATCTTKAVCDVCRTTYGGTAPHTKTQYGGKDSTGHWDTCSTCDNKFNFEAHTPDREKADETNPVKCTKCGFEITPAGHYEHTADSEWHNSADGTYHYHKCTHSGCAEILDKANHSGGTATCENKAVCSVCGVAYGEKLGHDYGEVKYTWTSDNTCKAESVCKHDSTHIESETVTATGTTITAATCKEKGKMKYTATFVNPAFAVQEKEVDIDFAPHTFGAWKDEIPATTEAFGTKGHKDCTVCGRHFDKDGKEITDLRIAKISTYNVTVNGESKFYALGESVTAEAEEKEGKVFKGWKDESGKIVSTKKEYTFKVEGETTLTAVYEDLPSGGGTADSEKPADGENPPVPDKKDGLSGGAIAGIAVGSAAVAGLGGFSVFWFAIRKKSFADLIAAIKRIPKRKES